MMKEMKKKEAIEIIKQAVNGNARKEDFFKLPDEIIGDVLEEYHQSKLKNNGDLGDVVESCLDDDDFECYTCDICGSELTDGEKHAKGCPNDDSTYAEYLRNGFG